MKTNYTSFVYTFIALIVMTAFPGCKKSEDGPETVKPKKKNLNITILADLSDRIAATENPQQPEKDTAAILTIVKTLKLYMEKKGIQHSEDRIKVVFYPSSNAEALTLAARNLKINFADFQGPDRRDKYEKTDSIYSVNLGMLYSFASNAGKFSGSDLFNFFRHRVKDDCISEDTAAFTDVLVILTDGYLYQKDFMYREGNRFSYIAPHTEQIAVFRNTLDWEKKFESEDYGLVPAKVSLPGLHILALEFAPYKGNTIDLEIMKKYWFKWFQEMNIPAENIKIAGTDTPALTEDIIINYFSRF